MLQKFLLSLTEPHSDMQFLFYYMKEKTMLKREQEVVFIFKGFESRFQIEESTLVARVIGAE